MKKSSIIIFLAAVLSLILSSCGGDNSFVRSEGMVWNTFYHITYRGPQSLQDSILPTLEKVSRSVSVFDENSIVSKVNSQSDTEVDSIFIKVYEMSRKVNRISGGAFDPTLSPLITAWGFGKGHTPTADTLRLDSLMQLVGITKTRIEGNRILKENPGIQFNFSAIAKGFGCDAVADMLRRNGVEDFMVEIGGEVVVHGVSPSGEKWKIAIETPAANEDDSQSASVVASFTDMAMASSGNYRNYHENADGKRFSHTISATTGRPVQSDVAGATVIAPSCMEADALSTSCMALGSSEAMRLLDSLGYPLYLILTDGSVRSNAKMNALLSK